MSVIAPTLIAALRAQACTITAALGNTLDALTLVEEIERGPQPADPADVAALLAPLIREHLTEASDAANQAALFASDLADDLERLRDSLDPHPHG